jgi:hypothetical protein
MNELLQNAPRRECCMASDDAGDEKIDHIEAEIRKALSASITDTLRRAAASPKHELALKLEIIDYAARLRQRYAGDTDTDDTAHN